jgi:hypothetical protein
MCSPGSTRRTRSIKKLFFYFVLFVTSVVKYLVLSLVAAWPRGGYAVKKQLPPFFLQRDRFNPLDFFIRECQLFSFEVLFHMLSARGSSQWEHPDLHGKSKNNLCGTRT